MLLHSSALFGPELFCALLDTTNRIMASSQVIFENILCKKEKQPTETLHVRLTANKLWVRQAKLNHNFTKLTCFSA